MHSKQLIDSKIDTLSSNEAVCSGSIECCSVLQCVAVCCSVLQCVAVAVYALQHAAVCYSVLQCVALCLD